MIQHNPPRQSALDTDAEIAQLTATLHRAAGRLEELTGGEVDAVIGPDGRTFLLRDAQDWLRNKASALKGELDFITCFDPLTRLANRGLFLERLAQSMRKAATDGHKLAVFIIDLERFKSINDSYGEAAGDSLLEQVAQWLTRAAGDAGLVARVGPDHFAALLPKVRAEGDMQRLIEQTIGTFLTHPFHIINTPFRIAAKVGAALFPEDGDSADALFKNAEAALKKAKASDRRYLFYRRGMTGKAAGRASLENQLRHALDNEEFVLHYQPKVSLLSGEITSAEALIRWNDPRTGLVPPGKFIPVLEETGLIHDVGRWALGKAIDEHPRWRHAGLPALRIAVNVSPLQLRDSAFVADIRKLIDVHADAAAGLELEITESLIMEDVELSIRTLQAIRDMGVTVAIDDFGTGFSSLSHLFKLPVDTLKIDRAFVTELTAGPREMALVRTIIDLTHSMRIKAVAEGVETDEQANLLRLLRCDEMQGYLFCKPVPTDEFQALVLARARSAAARQETNAQH